MEFNNEWLNIFNKSKEKIVTINEATKEKEILETANYFERPVLGKILILQRHNAEKFKYEKPWACISISDSFSDFDAEINEENNLGILRLKFDDTEFPTRGVPISTEQADSILEFAFKIWDKVDLMLIHCNAGISRSPAVGKFLSEIYQPMFCRYFDAFYSPNKLVTKVLKESLES